MTAAKKRPAAKKAAKKAPTRKRAPAKETDPPYTIVDVEAAPAGASILLTETPEAGIKSGVKSGDAGVPLVPMVHGGAIRRGSLPGNTPGSGRPKDEVRAAFLGVSQKGAAFLNELMDGVVKVDFVGVCPHCSETSEPPVPATLVKSLLTSLNASMDARLRATDMSARYGLSAKELVIASPQAKAFFDCVHAAIVECAGEDVAAQVQTRAVALMDEARA